MNTLTKITILVVLLVAYIFQSATPAFADELFRNADTVTGHKANSHIAKVWSKHTHGSEACTANFVPALNDYLDGDTPADTAYGDYLSDLQWWTVQYDLNSNPCNVTPESMPQ